MAASHLVVLALLCACVSGRLILCGESNQYTIVSKPTFSPDKTCVVVLCEYGGKTVANVECDEDSTTLPLGRTGGVSNSVVTNTHFYVLTRRGVLFKHPFRTTRFSGLFPRLVLGPRARLVSGSAGNVLFIYSNLGVAAYDTERDEALWTWNIPPLANVYPKVRVHLTHNPDSNLLVVTGPAAGPWMYILCARHGTLLYQTQHENTKTFEETVFLGKNILVATTKHGLLAYNTVVPSGTSLVWNKRMIGIRIPPIVVGRKLITVFSDCIAIVSELGMTEIGNCRSIKSGIERIVSANVLLNSNAVDVLLDTGLVHRFDVYDLSLRATWHPTTAVQWLVGDGIDTYIAGPAMVVSIGVIEEISEEDSSGSGELF